MQALVECTQVQMAVRRFFVIDWASHWGCRGWDGLCCHPHLRLLMPPAPSYQPNQLTSTPTAMHLLGIQVTALQAASPPLIMEKDSQHSSRVSQLVCSDSDAHPMMSHCSCQGYAIIFSQDNISCAVGS